MISAPPPGEAPHGTFTDAVATAAHALQRWVRFGAIVSAAAGVLTFAYAVIGSGFAAAEQPQYRGVIAGVATLRAVSGLLMMCTAFLLFRYARNLAAAAKQQRARLLLKAARYETAYWIVTAGYSIVWFFAIAIASTTPNAPGDTAFSFRNASRPPVYTLPPDASVGLNAIAAALVVAGAVLVLNALRPPRRRISR